MCLYSSLACAQSFSLDGLTGKTWRGVSGYGGTDYMGKSLSISQNTVDFKVWRLNAYTDVTIFVYDMYLSDTAPDVFDSTQVGKHNTGRFIIMNRPYNYKGDYRNDFIVEEIVSLSDNRLALKATNGNIIVYESE
ncbi:MAG: hypothetical protein J5610_06295 [Prevotella sp.]|nr:hypothetical protein [Prevotella sp.]